MSASRFPRWQPLAAAPSLPVHAANAGVSLSRSATGVLARAASPFASASGAASPPLPTVSLPMLSSEMVRRCAVFLSTLHRQNQCRAGMSLYLDFNSLKWLAALPHQLSSPTAFRANLREGIEARLPTDGTWRLAGSVQSLFMAEQAMATDAPYLDEVPGFDGVHVLIDPRHVFYPRVILRLEGDQLWEVEAFTAMANAATGFEAQAADVWCKGGDV